MSVTRCTCRRAGYLLSGSNIAPHTEHLSSLISSLTSHTYTTVVHVHVSSKARLGPRPQPFGRRKWSCKHTRGPRPTLRPSQSAHTPHRADIARASCPHRPNYLYSHESSHAHWHTPPLHLSAPSARSRPAPPSHISSLELRSPTHGDFDPRNRLLRERADVIEVKQALRLLQAMNFGGSSLGLR